MFENRKLTTLEESVGAASRTVADCDGDFQTESVGRIESQALKANVSLLLQQLDKHLEGEKLNHSVVR